MIVGARTGDNVKIHIKKIPKMDINKLANHLTNIEIPDIISGLRIMKEPASVTKSASEMMTQNIEHSQRFIKILSDGFSFTTTITLAMLTNHMQVLFLPINYRHRKDTSKIRPIYDNLIFFQLIIRTCLYFEPLKIFIPFTLIFVFIFDFSFDF